MPPASASAGHFPSVLFVTPESAPLVKTGGLGDVSAALPAALRGLGLDVRVLMPGFPAIMAANPKAAEVARMTVLDQPVRLLMGELPSGVPLYILDNPRLYDRGGGPYQADDGSDWDDNALRFGVLSKAAAMLGTAGSPIGWLPDVVHAHDWPAALAPLYLRHESQPHAASLITIHNLAFQGNFEMAHAACLELPPQTRTMHGMEFYGRASFLKAGLVYADAINTVSPTYAQEIQTEALGFGMDGVLRHRRADLYGVLNGIDTALWNPQTDPHLATRYGPLTLDRKLENKLAFKNRMKLGGKSDVPLFAMVSRLTDQKGIDVVIAAAERLAALPAQIVVVGTGDRTLVARLQAMQARLKDSMAIFIGYDESLAHLLEGGADVFLMPSRFEPCGMNQMYSQRYGTPPLGNSTGGLVDTITDEALGIGDARPTGFLMREATPDELLRTAERAVRLYREPRAWRAMQLNGMARDFGWAHAAQEYVAIYEKIATPGSDH